VVDGSAGFESGGGDATVGRGAVVLADSAAPSLPPPHPAANKMKATTAAEPTSDEGDRGVLFRRMRVGDGGLHLIDSSLLRRRLLGRRWSLAERPARANELRYRVT